MIEFTNNSFTTNFYCCCRCLYYCCCCYCCCCLYKMFKRAVLLAENECKVSSYRLLTNLKTPGYTCDGSSNFSFWLFSFLIDWQKLLLALTKSRRSKGKKIKKKKKKLKWNHYYLLLKIFFNVSLKSHCMRNIRRNIHLNKRRHLLFSYVYL